MPANKLLRASRYEVVNYTPLGMEAQAEICAAAKEGGLPTFAMNAYNGGELHVDGWDGPVVVDLQGCLDAKRQQIPMLHEHNKLVGHSTAIDISATKINIAGVLSGVNEETKEIVATGLNGFVWQASIGVRVRKVQRVPSGQTVRVNDRTFAGPITVARQWKWKETTFCKWGADDTTSARISATAKGKEMDPELKELLASLGIDEADVTAEQLAAAQNVLAKSKKPDSEGSEKDLAAKEGEQKKPGDEDLDIRAALRKEAVDEISRISSVRAKFTDYPELAAKAIAEQWDVARQDVELRAAKAEAVIKQRPSGIHGFSVNLGPTGQDESKVIEAALALSCGVSHEFLVDPTSVFDLSASKRHARRTVSAFDEKTLDAAESTFRGIGLQEVVLWAARTEANYNGIWGNGEQALRASFSTLALPNVFRNTLNRILLQAYSQLELTWPKLAKTSTAKDFRTVDKFRVFGTGQWEVVGQDGELKTGTLAEGPTYTNQLKTYGQHNVLTRQDFINDDLGALNDIGMMMARYGALGPEFGLYRTLLANQAVVGGSTINFFSAGRGNLETSAPLSLPNLGKVHTRFKKKRETQTGKDSRNKAPAPAIVVQPKKLLVPVELELLAWELMNTTSYQSGGGEAAGTRVSDRNFFAGRYEIITTPYLSDTAIHANANATSYYLFADPGLVPVLDVMFLNGQQMPVIESAEAQFNQLGVQFRGYTDFGISFCDEHGAVRADA